MEFIIEDNIPIPEESKNRTKTEYPIKKLKVTQSFKAPKDHIYSIRSIISQMKKTGSIKRFFTKRIDGAPGMYRIWRIE